MFRGANKVTLDAKGRLAMPARYRDTLVERSEGRLVTTVDRSDRCLLIYPLPDWEEIERKLMRLPTLNPQARRLAVSRSHRWLLVSRSTGTPGKRLIAWRIA